jgi:hypothetical protein
MATRTISNAGGNYNALATWVEGIVPTSADDVVATATSGQLTVNVSSAAKSIDFTNYTNTLTMTNTLTVSGNITLVAGMTISGSGGLVVDVSATLTSNGKTWPNQLAFGAITVTLADDWTVGSLRLSGAGTGAINGFTISITGGLTSTTATIFSGTTELILIGTGTWNNTSTGIIRNNLTINTSGTITVSGTVRYNTGTLTYIAGTVVTTGSSIIINGSTTLDTDGINWATILFGAGTMTLTSNLTINTTWQNSNGPTYNGSQIILNGSMVMNQGCAGTTTLLISGTGSWSGTGILGLKMTINTAGTFTIISSVGYNANTLTYITGTVVTTGSSITINVSITLDTDGIVWNNMVFQGNGVTYTLTSNLTINGIWSNSNPHTFNGSQIILNGSMLINQAITGTATLLISGTGSWSSGGNIGLAMTINTAGTFTVSGLVSATNLTYVAGTVVTAGSTLNNGNGGMWDTAGIVWNNIGILAGTQTLNSLLTAIGTMTVGTSNTVTFAGTDGFNVGTFICTTAGRTINFTAGRTYDVTTLFQLKGTNASRIFFKSLTASSYAFFNLQSGATCDIKWVNATDIDSSGGRLVTNIKGTLLRTINWAVYNPDMFALFNNN